MRGLSTLLKTGRTRGDSFSYDEECVCYIMITMTTIGILHINIRLLKRMSFRRNNSGSLFSNTDAKCSFSIT